jgi:hypothetical protein
MHGAPGRTVRERRRFTPTTLARVVGLWALMALASTGNGLGHDGFTGITLEPPRVNPGGVVVITGHQVATDEPVAIVLAGPTGRTQLATAVTDGMGHFTVGPTIPAETPSGTYVIEVGGQSGVYMSVDLVVEGSPIFDGQNGAPAGQDEGLPGVAPVSTKGSVAAGPQRDLGVTATTPEVDPVPIVALALAVGALGFLVWRTRRPAAPTSRTGSADLP